MAGLIRWFCRCIPGFSIILWTFVCWQALSGRLVWPWSLSDQAHRKSFDWQHLDAWQFAYIVYSVLAHLSACLIFPVRLCWAIWHITDEVRCARFDAAELSRPYDTESEASAASSNCTNNSNASSSGTTAGANSTTAESDKLSVGVSSAATLTPDASLSRVSTPKLGYFEEFPEPVIHAIILPSYKEDMGTLVQTLNVLASHCLAKSSYDVSLDLHHPAR
jgi:hypothetical protein